MFQTKLYINDCCNWCPVLGSRKTMRTRQSGCGLQGNNLKNVYFNDQ